MQRLSRHPTHLYLQVYLESDVDEQLLIFFPFEVPVNLGAIGFTSPPDGTTTERE